MKLGGVGRLLARSAPSAPEDQAARAILDKVAVGGARFERLVLTHNRRVMASVVDGGGTLRLSRVLARAPDEVLAALGRIFGSRSGATRARARAEVQSYLAHAGPAPPTARPRSHRVRPSDRPHLERLREEFERVNRDLFGGRLPAVPLRLSGRMRRRNGHFSVDPLEIAISRRLLDAAADGEAERTLRHEMIHLWQWVDGHKPGHGKDFRRWARRLEIHPRATRTVCWSQPD